MPRLVQILLPIYDNQGSKLAPVLVRLGRDAAVTDSALGLGLMRT
jgi:hypothetical protein